MSNQLNNLISTLQKNKELGSGISVQTESNLIKMEVVGYIPIPSAFAINVIVDLYKDYIIGPDRIRFHAYYQNDNRSRYIVFPISKMIRIQNNNDKIAITPNLKIMEEIDNASLTNYNKFYSTTIETYRNKYENELIAKSTRFIKGETGEEKGKMYYCLNNEDIVFYKYNIATAIAQDFVCLCQYISYVNGTLEYCLKNPSDLIQIINDKDEQKLSF